MLRLAVAPTSHLTVSPNGLSSDHAVATLQALPAQPMARASQPRWLRRRRHQAGIAAVAAVAVAALAYPVLQNVSRWPLTVR